MTAICPVCGKEFDDAKEHGGRPKRYCSVRCRGIYHCRQYQRKQREAKVAAIKARQCAFCGKDFKPSVYRSNQKFCSHSCWLAACRAEYAAKRAELLAARPKKTCAFCGKEFTPSRRDAIYCSKKCGDVDYFRRHREELRAKERAYRATHPRPGHHAASHAVKHAAKHAAKPTADQAYEASVARVRAYLKLPARARWANRGMLTDTELRMAEQMWENGHGGWNVLYNTIR